MAVVKIIEQLSLIKMVQTITKEGNARFVNNFARQIQLSSNWMPNIQNMYSRASLDIFSFVFEIKWSRSYDFLNVPFNKYNFHYTIICGPKFVPNYFASIIEKHLIHKTFLGWYFTTKKLWIQLWIYTRQYTLTHTNTNTSIHTHLWYNGYCGRKWIHWPEYKFWTRIFAFHIALGKVWNLTILPPAMGKL